MTNTRDKCRLALIAAMGAYRDGDGYLDGAWDAGVSAVLEAIKEPGLVVVEIGNDVSEDAGDVWDPSNGVSYGGPHCGLEVWQAMLKAVQEGK